MSKQKNGSIWYVSIEGSKKGPFTFDEVQISLRTGTFTVENLVWRAGMNDWYRILDVAEFREVVREIAPDKLENDQSSFLKEKLVCPNCFTKIPVTAMKCPSCELVLKKQRGSFAAKVQKESWHFRIAFIGGIVMLFSLFFPWVVLSKDFSKTGSGLSVFNVLLGLGLLIVTFSVQNLILKNKRNLIVWLCALAGFLLLLMFASDLVERKQQIQQFHANVVVTSENLPGTSEILGVGVYVFGAGTLIVLFAMTLPMVFGLIRKPVGSFGMIMLALLIFLSYMQLMNGNAYKYVLSWQLQLKDYEIVNINRIYNPQDADIEKTATFEIYVKQMENENTKQAEQYYYGVKSIKLGTLGSLSNLKLSRVKKVDFNLYPEFTKIATEDAHENN